MKARVWLLVSALVMVAFVIVAASRDPSPAGPAGAGAIGTPTASFQPPGPTGPVGQPPSMGPPSDRSSTGPSHESTPPPSAGTTSTSLSDQGSWHPTPVFRGRLMVAYYGTAGTGSMGVLGSGPIPHVTHELRTAAQGFAQASGRRVQIVYELIATVTDDYPGEDGTYSHDIARADVEAYLHAARRNHALLVLDLQPGRSNFLTVAKRYAWALKQPDVGLALDPEWRMHGHDVPGEVIGWVGADEVTATARYVASIAREYRLPQKLFLIHQFVPQSVDQEQDITPEKGLAMVQHVDGWGAEADKLATFHAVARPQQFTIGFKLFYREDIDLMTPSEVLAEVPGVRFISYQ